jgi:predicted nucleic acid-binding protein
MKIIVSNSGPIISFCRAERLDILKLILSEIVIPRAVYIEVVEHGHDRPGSKEIINSMWIQTREITNINGKHSLPDTLGSGEKEAIILAEELDGFILLDDRRARNEAKSRKLKVISSIDILLQAKFSGVIYQIKPVLAGFIKTGFRLSKELYREILLKAGEK